MATVFSAGMFPVGVSLGDEGQCLSDLPRDTLPAPQLVMLANVAAVTAAEGGDGGSVADEKEMMELKTVGCSYSDSEDESVIRYSYDNQNQREVCIVEYPESPSPAVQSVLTGAGKEENKSADKRPPSFKPRPSNNTPQQALRVKDGPALTESAQKKKPFCCKPCHFQGKNEQEFVEHLGTHSISKMLVVNQVEGRSKSKAKGAESQEAVLGREAEHKDEEAATGGDVKGLIRCERCGYNTNRYDHYIAHLKHHSKEGDDHRVLKCTLCAYTTVSQYHWRKHLRNHFPSKLHTCSQCSYFSDRKSNYIQHIRTHTGVRPFQCPYCDYSSSQKTHLTRHMRTHSGERPFKCESCSYLAANQHEVTRHARQVHNGPKPLSCPYCEYKTADRSNFKKHVELHLNPRQFLCPLCKYAASKKCNLQYHIKSRHSGCSVDLDVSKVKLRVKKAGSDGADDKPESKAAKMDDSPTVEEDLGEEDDSSPINLSIKRSRPGTEPPSHSETPEKAAKKRNVFSDKERVARAKEAEKRVSTRQRKVKENPVETTEEVQSAAGNTDNKVKRRVRKVLTEKMDSQDPPEGPTSQEDQTDPKSSDQQTSTETSSEKDVNVSSYKEKRRPGRTRKSGDRRSERNPELVDTQRPKSSGKKVKEKPSKRKSGQALDLSENSSKKKCLNCPAAEKLLSKPSPDETAESEPSPLSSADSKSSLDGTGKSKLAPDSMGKSKPSPNETAECQQSPHSIGESKSPLDGTGEFQLAPDPTGQSKIPLDGTGKSKPSPDETTECQQSPHRTVESTSSLGGTEKSKLAPDVTAESKLSPDSTGKSTLSPDCITESKTSSDSTSESSPTDRETPVKKKTRTTTRKTSAVVPKRDESMSKANPSLKVLEGSVQPTGTGSGGLGSSTDGPTQPAPNKAPSSPSGKTFIKPLAPPRLVLPGQRGKPADAEDDEGIHSSHEGGSDISDSASEGSDDSGLNGTGGGAPGTPSEEIPTPTELKSHTCIFCDRTFPMENQYRRHLNRHLVNVYYMDPGAPR